MVAPTIPLKELNTPLQNVTAPDRLNSCVGSDSRNTFETKRGTIRSGQNTLIPQFPLVSNPVTTC